MSLFHVFRLTRLIQISDGEIKLMKRNVGMFPYDIIANLQQSYFNSHGFQETYNFFFNEAKKGSKEFHEYYIQHLGYEDKRKIIELQRKLAVVSGFGKIELAYSNFSENQFKFKVTHSPFVAKLQKQSYPVDLFLTGYFAGALESILQKPVYGIETKCEARNHDHCLLEFGDKNFIEKLMNEIK